MAQDADNTQARDNNPQQGTSRTSTQQSQGDSSTQSASQRSTSEQSGTQRDASEQSGTQRDASGQSGSQRNPPDQERAIQTTRESGRQRSVSRRQQAAPMRGVAASPFLMMQQMAQDMDRLLTTFGFGGGLGRSAFNLGPDWSAGTGGSDLLSAGTGLEQALWAPPVEIFRRGNKLVVRADLPGMSEEDVNVEIDNDTLVISGERVEEHDENRGGYFRTERTYGQFYRAIPLPEGINPDSVEASFRDGVLEITLDAPKEQENRPRQIPVRK